jgi:hypothetical protein
MARTRRNELLALAGVAVATFHAACGEPSREQAQRQETPHREETSRMIAIGDTAPDFTLKDQNRQAVTLVGEFRGQKKVVLAFYVFAFTGG